MSLEQGQRIGDRYTLVGRLGSGGMADVWLADDEMLGRRVALKFLHERFAQDAQFVERFRREAQAAAGLQHPNVVGVYDRGETDGRHWIAMEYVEGAALKDLVTRGLTVGESVEIVRQVLAGTSFAHERGIIHRDLKPQNVLVDREGRARVADFGIARAGASEITQTGSVLGTAQYLSPEQAQGLETNATSDLYSIGVILYECLTGRVPFEADSPVAVALKQISEPPRRPSELNPQVPPALDAVVLRALAKDPANRFQSAGEFIAALDAAEVDPSGGTALAAVVAEAPQTVLEDEEAPWWRRWWVIALAVLALLIAGVVAFALTRPGTVNVPAVVEQPLSAARSLLERKGFDVGVLRVENCATADTVTEQQPAAGSEVDEGSEVTLTVSLGLSVKVPDLHGLDVKEATKRLGDEQLLADTTEQSSRDVDPGHVIRTDPAVGEEVDCQSTVTLVVSKGANTISLPSVIGEDETVARSQLENLGLIVNVDTKDADDPEGTVIGQDPGPDSQLLRGDRVTIIVSTGAGSVIVPDVVGQSEDAARSALQGRGLAVDVIDQDTDVKSEDGRVLQQAPSPGSRVHGGDQVTIVVAHFVEPEPTTTSTTPSTTTSTTSTTTTTP
ncbi:MAG: eukaryotic-like serine/threonine-protein kinase [Solirubrobacterales bacterium]|jgi:serine/threonine-protein kinase|nr:eukaryotic-like serine/threonine-protein kinase [Solirubrobacterales bacterium]